VPLRNQMKQSNIFRLPAFFPCVLGIALLIQMRALAPGETRSEGEQLAQKSDCLSCHAVDHKVVGPAFSEVASRYAGKAGVESTLIASIKEGGSGQWGDVPMTPHRKLSDEQIRKMVDWILSLKSEASGRQAPPRETFTYKAPNGETVTTDFPVFLKGRESDHVVTEAAFTGWLQFNSTCFRCHGLDATGSSYAPDLRKSLRDGMTEQQFIAIAMVGVKAKGMPGWAGFYDEPEMVQIYHYVKARSLGLIPEGRPKSSTD
jgi:cytochrome c